MITSSQFLKDLQLDFKYWGNDNKKWLHHIDIKNCGGSSRQEGVEGLSLAFYQGGLAKILDLFPNLQTLLYFEV